MKFDMNEIYENANIITLWGKWRVEENRFSGASNKYEDSRE